MEFAASIPVILAEEKKFTGIKFFAEGLLKFCKTLH